MSKNNIAKDSFILTFTQFMTLGVNMINAMLLSRFRTLGEYGTYSQVMVVCTIIITFFSAGFSQCINYFLGKCESDIEREKFVKSYYSIITIIGAVGGIISLILLPIIQRYYGNFLLYNYWFVFLFYPLSHILTSGTDRFFIAFKKTKYLLFFKVGHSIIVLSEIILTILLNLTFYQYMIIYVFVEVMFGFSVFLWIRGIIGIVPFGLKKDYVVLILKFAIPMALASLVSSINTEMDKLIVGGLVDTDTFAIYTNAAKELPIYIFSTSISSVVMPFVVRKVTTNDYQGTANLWKKSIVLSFYIISFCVSALFVFAPQVISLLYSDKYLPGVWIFRIYSLVLLFRVTYYGMVLNALGKTKTILKASIATMMINLVLDLLLYKLFGLIGPAIATLVSVAVMNVYQLLLTCKHIGVCFTDIYPIRTMLSILFINIILGGIFFVLQQLLQKVLQINTIVLAIVLGIIWLVIYFCLIYKKIILIWNELNKGKSEND